MDSRLRYLCIDLKSFYASAECVARGYDPNECRLVVADPARGPGALCLAVSPALRALGVPNRCRVRDIPSSINYVIAPPRMRYYMDVSAQIVGIYLRWVSPEDLHVYSVDECFIDAGPYLALYNNDACGLSHTLMEAVQEQTGICATAGVGTNLFLAKVALDLFAKHSPDHVAVLDEDSYKMRVWTHQPITDVWGVGPGSARRLARCDVHNMGGVALMDEQVLQHELGVKAEVLRDHAWGLEPCTMDEIHAWQPSTRSKSSSQILPRDYRIDEVRVILREMVEALSLELVGERLVCGGMSLDVSLGGDAWEGRDVWPHVSASCTLDAPTSSRHELVQQVFVLLERLVGPGQSARRLGITLCNLQDEHGFTPPLPKDPAAEERERAAAEAQVAVRQRFGKNALVHGTSLLDCATGRERNVYVGGHHE